MAEKMPQLHEDFDLVGIDTRGIGPDQGAGAGATTLTCSDKEMTAGPLTLPGWASSDLREASQVFQQRAARCAASTDGLMPFISHRRCSRSRRPATAA
jgi:hypothetical protein